MCKDAKEGHVRVLLVLYYYRPYVSGLSELARTLAENLVREGIHVTVLTTRHDRRLSAGEIINGVEVVRVPILGRLGKGVVAPSLVVHAVRLSQQFDVVNFHLPIAEAGIASLFIPREKLITYYHCDLDLGPSLFQKGIEKVSYLLMSIALRRSSRVIVTSRDYFAHSYFSNFLPKTVAVYPPIEDSRFRKVSAGALRERLNVQEGIYAVGFVGRIVREKGLQYLLQAVEILKGRIKDFRVIIAGDFESVAGGSIREELEPLLRNCGDRVTFTGFLGDEDLLAFYSMIDVLVLPSVNPLEAFGMVQVEALFCGTPVIATDLPGVREVVRRTGIGLIVHPADPLDLADAIMSMMKQPPAVLSEHLEPFRLLNTMRQYRAIFSGTRP